MEVKKFDLSRLSGNRIFNPELIDYEDSVDIIGDEIHSVRKSFVKIGWHLKHIKEKGTYQRDGYKDIFEFAHAKFKMSEGTVNRMINLCIEFSVGHDSPELDERYLGFDESQLFEMLPMKESERDEISPDMTVKQIREKKAENKAMKEPSVELVSNFLKGQGIVLSDYETISDLKKFMVDTYGKRYKSGDSPCKFECTHRGIRLKSYDENTWLDEITWLAFAKKAWVFKESESVDTPDGQNENTKPVNREKAAASEPEYASLIEEATELSQNLFEGFRFSAQNHTLSEIEKYKAWANELNSIVDRLSEFNNNL